MKSYPFFTFFLVLTFFSSFKILAQSSELDSDFLGSLPEELRSEVNLLNDIKDDDEIDALLNSRTSLEKTTVLIKKLRGQLENIEERVRVQLGIDNQNDKLPIFGQDFFRTVQSTFAPINLPNMEGSYIVDIGDTFNITVVGSSDADLEVGVGRDGNIIIPRYGKLQIAGLSLTQADNKFQEFFSTKALGSEAYMQLSKIRDMQIIILGEVELPGIYTMSGGSNILSAINVAGGISDSGSYRTIEHVRNGNILQQIDLYDLFIAGDNTTLQKQLRSGDMLFIRPLSFHVPVTGGVNNPAIFEIVEGESLEEIISYAGGFSQDFYGYNSVKVFRSDLLDAKFIDVKSSDLANYFLQPRDALLVPSFKNDLRETKFVQIQGRVKNPGVYFINDGDKLSDLVLRAGGYLDDAYIYGAALFREEAASKEESFHKINYRDTLTFVISNIGKPAANLGAGVLPLLEAELRSKEFVGRLVSNFNLDQIKKDPSLDTVLFNEDKIIIPQIQKVVSLFGDFNNPSNYSYVSGRTIKEYIKLAGGKRKSANKDVIIINPDGTTQLYSDSLLSFGDAEIYPGTVIYSPRNIGQLDGILYASTVSPIISSLALSLASLNSIISD
ncbi:SLBB domain-containing protein [Gammaproteobacteria bacterium]|nr:SLBB domain-containing protein [Gammaproteobacteria bacterium]MDC0128995.1 SLBB domain-containing protein [Gammaproteobacteria bacterium]